MAALLETIGSGAVTAPFNEVEYAEVIIVIGANPTENHPVAATFFKNAAKKGSKLIVMDPRGQALKNYATLMLQFKPGTDVALLNSIMNVIVEQKLYDEGKLKPIPLKILYVRKRCGKIKARLKCWPILSLSMGLLKLYPWKWFLTMNKHDKLLLVMNE